MKPLKFLLVCCLAPALLSCGKNLEGQLKDAVRRLDNADLKEDAVEILQVTESGDFAIAEVRVKTAFKLRRKGDAWVVDEIRIGDRRWEKAETILAAINAKRADDTRLLLDEMTDAISIYARRQGRVPQAADFESLVDALSPHDLKRVVRLDAWSNPFFYQPLSENAFDLRSAGPDGQFQTGDDLVARSPQ